MCLYNCCSAGLIDYNPLPVSVQFSQTDDRKCFQIAIINDFDREDIEAFEVALLPNTGVTLMNPYVATVTITDDDNNRKWSLQPPNLLIYKCMSCSLLIVNEKKSHCYNFLY